MIETVSNRILYIVFILGSIAWCAAAKADLMQDYETLMYFAKENVEHARREKKLETRGISRRSTIYNYFRIPSIYTGITTKSHF